jgi:hypothetical protein
LQLGSMYPQIRAVVAYVPANVRYAACCGNTRVPYAWTWKGQPLSFLPAQKTFSERACGPAREVDAAIDGGSGFSTRENNFTLVGQTLPFSLSYLEADRLHLKHPDNGFPAFLGFLRASSAGT